MNEVAMTLTLIFLGFTVINLIIMAVGLKMLTEIYKEHTIKRRYESQGKK